MPKKLKLLLIPIAILSLFLIYSKVQTPTTESNPNMAGEKINKEQYPFGIFAGGCFWCTESDFEKTTGVVDAISGYIGGEIENPTYEQVSSGKTKYREAAKIYYDPNIITYDQLLDVYWRHIDPTDKEGQFADRGHQYTPAIYYKNNEERSLATDSKTYLQSTKFKDTIITTEILPISTFYPAEDYHQNYHKKNKIHYNLYRNGSGRNQYIEKTWGEELNHAQQLKLKKQRLEKITSQPCQTFDCYIPLTNTEIKNKLTQIQYQVTQQDGTEQPFNNKYWDNKEEGIYVDIVSGEPLFSSIDKYVSGTGWPSFVKPISEEFIELKIDYDIGYPRVEVRSKLANSHIGHIFPDGPADKGGNRWCMNSAAMKFIPKSELKNKGYEKYLEIFQ